jgi:hypothetical protein
MRKSEFVMVWLSGEWVFVRRDELRKVILNRDLKERLRGLRRSGCSGCSGCSCFRRG